MLTIVLRKSTEVEGAFFEYIVTGGECVCACVWERVSKHWNGYSNHIRPSMSLFFLVSVISTFQDDDCSYNIAYINQWIGTLKNVYMLKLLEALYDCKTMSMMYDNFMENFHKSINFLAKKWKLLQTAWIFFHCFWFI